MNYIIFFSGAFIGFALGFLAAVLLTKASRGGGNEET